MTGPYERPDFPYADKPAEEQPEPPARITWDEFKAGAEVPPPAPDRKLRMGDKVRCTALDDPFIDHGVEGIIVNIAPPRPNTAGRARILWSTDQLCMMDATDFEVITHSAAKPQQPTVMGAFGARQGEGGAA